MKKSLKSLSCALAVVFTLSFSVTGNTTALGLTGSSVDTVTTATTTVTTPTTPKAPAKTPTKVTTPKAPTKTKTTKTTKAKTATKAKTVTKAAVHKTSTKVITPKAPTKTITKTTTKASTTSSAITSTKTPDVITSASVVNNSIDFQKSIGKNGKWIIAITKDLSVYKPLVLEGQFKNGKKDAVTGADLIQRKIALYTQDDKHVVTARFSLRAPKLTILSPNASIQHGTFKGDLYVSVPYFKLVDAKVVGNVYFTTKAAETTFTMDATSSITGKQELQLGADVVSSASVVDNEADFEKAISIDGKWIIATLKDLTINKPLILEGKFKNGKKDTVTGLDAIQRKIGLYTQDDKHVVTARFTLTAPKLTILSPKASIQHGTFKGDLYVSVPYFSLVDAKVDGNVYFTTIGAQTTFNMDAKSIVTGKQESQLGVDVVSSASVVDNGAAFEKAISIDGKWIIATLKDLTFNKPLVLEGKFKNGKKDAVTGADLIQRKIALYTQDDKRVVTARFTLTAPKLTILSPLASIQHGTFKGDLYVSAANFSLVDAKVDGNVYFTTKEAQDTFLMDTKSSVTGKQELKN